MSVFLKRSVLAIAGPFVLLAAGCNKSAAPTPAALKFPKLVLDQNPPTNPEVECTGKYRKAAIRKNYGSGLYDLRYWNVDSDSNSSDDSTHTANGLSLNEARAIRNDVIRFCEGDNGATEIKLPSQPQP